MVLLNSPICDQEKVMPSFELLNIDGTVLKSRELVGKSGTLIMFICNHCPYVKAIINKIVETTNELEKFNIKSIAIMPNDSEKYPEDSFENMKIFANKHRFNFPYLIDKTQKISMEFGAVCTPDFFGFNSDNKLNYRGRIGLMNNLQFTGKTNELLDAMKQIAKVGKGPGEQFSSAGCSIKWKTN
jgi:peroxiredoxin